MKKGDRRRSKRLRIDRSVRVPVQIAPILPFLGDAVGADSINISEGGIALKVPGMPGTERLERDARIRIHIRLPGRPLLSCTGIVRHKVAADKGGIFLGILFRDLPVGIRMEIERMAVDNELCDDRIERERSPWCLPTCSFRGLCRKPIRDVGADDPVDGFELSLDTAV